SHHLSLSLKIDRSLSRSQSDLTVFCPYRFAVCWAINRSGVAAMESQPEKKAAQQIESHIQSLGLDSVENNIAGLYDSIKRFGRVDPANVQQIAASQVEFLARYHQIALAQSRRSFFWALVGSGVGLIFFVAAVAFALGTGITLAAVVPLLSGAVVE